jgi:hypothetical protein
MTRRITLIAAAAATALAAGAAGAVVGADAAAPGGQTDAAQAAQATPLVRLDGIGPLRLGMTRAAGLRTGWLSNRGRGCELGGPPIPITYRLAGPRAPAGVRAVAEFDDGELENIAFTRGVRTATGVRPGVTTARGMVNRYRDAGFAARAQFVSVFQGTFVTVRRRGRQVIGGFARGRVTARRPISTLGIPFVPTCE